MRGAAPGAGGRPALARPFSLANWAVIVVCLAIICGFAVTDPAIGALLAALEAGAHRHVARVGATEAQRHPEALRRAHHHVGADLQSSGASGERHGRQRHVQGEEAVPRVPLEEQRRGDQAQHRAAAGDPHPDADGPGPLLRRERGGDDRQGGRHDRGRADPHHAPDQDERLRVVRGEAGCCRHAEHDEARGQEPPPAEAVAQGAREEEQPGEDDGVGVDDPGELGLAGSAFRFYVFRMRESSDKTSR